MFDFERFPVYIKTSSFLLKLQPILKSKIINNNTRDQLYRASSSIFLNIAEGAGKYAKKDKKNFYTVARGSTQECVAIISLLKLENNISEKFYTDLYNDLTEISKMLSGLINKMLNP